MCIRDRNLVVSGGSGAANALPAALVSNIEVLNVRNVSAGVVSLNASTIAGLTGIYADRSSAVVTLTNVADDAVVGVKGNGTLVNGAFNFGYKTDTAAISLAIADGVTAGAITGNSTTGADAATSATITSTGAANVVGTVDLLTGASTLTSLTIDAATNLKGQIAAQAEGDFAANSTLTVKGAATTVELTGALANNLKTVDASGLTAGGVKATLGTGTEDYKGGAGVDTIVLSTGVKTATFGAGNDVVTTAAVASTTASTIDGGDGSDTLAIGATTDVDTAAKRAVYTNFEILQNNTTSNIAASDFSGSTSVITNGDSGGFTGLSATQAADVTVTAAQTGGLTYALQTATGTSDVLSVKFGDATGAALDIAGAFTVNGFETLNLKANAKAGNADQTTSIGSFAADKLTALTLTGSAFTLVNAATTKAVAIDASALTGDGAATPVGLTIAGNLAVGSTVTGSDLKDAISLGTAGSTYNMGAGNDTFAATAVTQLRSGAVYNTLNGGEGTDSLSLTANAVSMVDDDFKGITGIEEVTVDADAGAGDVSITTGGWYDTNFKTAGSDLTILVANEDAVSFTGGTFTGCLLYTSPSPRDRQKSRMPSSA
eukprot:TRINITY_DN16104_c0_g1_i1.p1 TRINITY_DN16104_c0_g1~~TRINITY_DN16104_c0_g1_i1.p1  ORF type:complete len:639 (+),score=78.25 TRINITY_DN16104_c0_g1_i1:108-1919(+)